jgi:hypothetical protein
LPFCRIPYRTSSSHLLLHMLGAQLPYHEDSAYTWPVAASSLLSRQPVLQLSISISFTRHQTRNTCNQHVPLIEFFDFSPPIEIQLLSWISSARPFIAFHLFFDGLEVFELKAIYLVGRYFTSSATAQVKFLSVL